MSDDSRQAPTTSDNASDPPISADDSRLTRTTIRLAAWQRRRLEEIAKRDGRLLSDVVREAVRDYLRK